MSDKPNTMLQLLSEMIADDPMWAARHITNMENELEELRAVRMKLETQAKALAGVLPDTGKVSLIVAS